MTYDKELYSLIPPILLQQPDFADRREREAAVLFVDVAGFTGLSEALALLGPEGAEVLEGTIAGYFNALLDVLERYGGVPFKIGGDALTVIFPGEKGTLPRLVRQAVACATALPQSLGPQAQVTTPQGTVTIAHKIGIGGGRLLSGLVGDPSIRLELAFAGSCLDESAAAEHCAKAGEVWAAPPIVAALQAPHMWDQLNERGFARLSSNIGTLPPVGDPAQFATPALPPLTDWHLSLVPASVRESARKGTLHYLCRHQTITVLFTSFSGLSFDNLGSLDHLDRHYRRMQKLVEEHGGFLSEFEAGDKGAKLIVLFGAPVPLEDPMGQAVRCAWAMQREARESTVVSDQRIGMTMGRLYVGRIGCRTLTKISALGDRMNLAARLMTASDSWTVLAERMIVQRTETQALWAPPQFFKVKGKQELISASALEGIRDRNPRERRGLGIVGREAEQALIDGKLAGLRNGVGGIVRISGEPGLGKTRLLEAVRRKVRESEDIGLLESHDYAMSPQSGPFQAWRSLLMDITGIDDDLNEEERTGKFLAWLRQVPDDLRMSLAHVTSVLDVKGPEDAVFSRLPPEQQLRVLRHAIVDCIQYGCSGKSRVLVVDNGQLLDEPSRSVLADLGPLWASIELLVIVAHRLPLEGHSDVFAELDDKAWCERIALEPLNGEESAELIRRQLEVPYLDSELEAFLKEKAQGNPLRMEAWLNILNDKGFIIREGGVASLTGSHRGLAVPDRLESLALVSLESLPSDAQLTLRVASVIGQSFTVEDLVHIHPERLDREKVDEHLRMGQQVKLLYYQRGNAQRMFFNRQEVREALHDSLPYQLRRKLHLHRVQQLKAHGGGVMDEEGWLTLAQHYEYIGEPLAQTRYFKKAADICIRRYDHRQAVTWLYRQLEASQKLRDVGGTFSAFRRLHNELGRLGEKEEDLQLVTRWVETAIEHKRVYAHLDALEVRSRCHQRIGNAEEAQKDLATALSLAQQRCPERLSQVYGAMSRVYAEMGRPKLALETIEEAIHHTIAQGTKPHAEQLVARGNALSQLGSAAEALKAFEELRPILDQEDLWTRAIVEGNIAVELFNLGRIEEGHESLVRALELKRQVGDRLEEAVALGNVGYSSLRIGALEDARKYSEASIRLSQRLRYIRVELNASGNLGETLWVMGELDEAARQYERVSALLAETPNRHLQLEHELRLGDLALTQGNPERALEIFEAALEATREAQLSGFEPGALEGVAEALRQQGALDRAWPMFEALLEKVEKTPHLVAFPQRACWRAAMAASALGDEENASRLKLKARRALEEALEHLNTDTSRERFIGAFPWNCDILKESGEGVMPGSYQSELCA